MSIKQQNYVVGIRGLSSSEAFVLYRLADHARNDGSRCFPGVQKLVEETRLDERTVRYLLRNLEDYRLLEPSVSGRKYEYTLRLEEAWKVGKITRHARARIPRRVKLEDAPPPGNLPEISTEESTENSVISGTMPDFEHENGQKSEIREISEEEIARLLQRVRDYDHAVVHRPEVAAMWKTGAESARQRLAEAGVQA